MTLDTRRQHRSTTLAESVGVRGAMLMGAIGLAVVRVAAAVALRRVNTGDPLNGLLDA